MLDEWMLKKYNKKKKIWKYLNVGTTNSKEIKNTEIYFVSLIMLVEL